MLLCNLILLLEHHEHLDWFSTWYFNVAWRMHYLIGQKIFLNILHVSNFCILKMLYRTHIHIVFQSLSCVWLFVTLWTAALQASLFFFISGVCSNSCPLSQWFYPTNSFCRPLLLLPSIFQHQGLFQWVSSSHQVAKVLELQLQHQSFQWIFRTDFL